MRIGCLVAAAGLYAYATAGLLSAEDPSGLLLLLAPLAWVRGEWLWQATSSDVLFVTTKRVFKVNSFLSKTMGAMPLRGLVDLTVHQPVLGRVLGYGHLTFESAAQRQGLDKFHYVGDPLGVSKQIQARAYGGGAGRRAARRPAGATEGGDGGLRRVDRGRRPAPSVDRRPVERAGRPAIPDPRAARREAGDAAAQRADPDALRDRAARAGRRGPARPAPGPGRAAAEPGWDTGPMTMPFSRPGAVDLSALKAPARAGRRRARGPGRRPGAGGSYAVQVDEQNFQSLLESSMTAPVVLVVYSPSRMPASVQLADDLADIADELEGRVAVGRVDVDAQPGIAPGHAGAVGAAGRHGAPGPAAPLLQDARRSRSCAPSSASCWSR